MIISLNIFDQMEMEAWCNNGNYHFTPLKARDVFIWANQQYDEALEVEDVSIGCFRRAHPRDWLNDNDKKKFIITNIGEGDYDTGINILKLDKRAIEFLLRYDNDNQKKRIITDIGEGDYDTGINILKLDKRAIEFILGQRYKL